MRRRSGVKRVGHAGTLDPMATGVLPVCFGQATRVIEYLIDATKTYVAEVTLGVETNTYDADGEIIARHDASQITSEAIDAALDAFRGEFEQTAPAFSAIKRDGVPLYKLARRGEAVEPPTRRVRVDRLQLISAHPEALEGPPAAARLTLEVDCSKGFYVRSLAHDLGASLGTGGMLSGLVRSRVGSFQIKDAVDIETLRAELENDTWAERLFAPDEILLDWQAAIVSEANEHRLRTGQHALLEAQREAASERCRAYNLDGAFLAVLRRADAASWRPEKVFVQ